MTTDDLTWDESLLADQPDSLLHWFATECALRAIERERARGGALASDFERAVAAKRRFLAGELTLSKLQKIRKDLKKRMPDADAATCFDRSAEVQAATHAATACVECALEDNAGYASSRSWWQLLYAEECAAEIFGTDMTLHESEQARLVDVVRRLKSVWAEHGASAPKVLEQQAEG